MRKNDLFFKFRCPENNPLTLILAKFSPMLTTHNEMRAPILAHIFLFKYLWKRKTKKKQFPHEILTQWNSWNVSKAYVTAQRWKSWSRSKEGQYFWEWAIFLGMGNIFGDGHYSRGSRHAAVLNLAASLKSLPCTSRVPTVCPGYRTLTKPVEKHIVREIYVACFICNCLLSCSIISDASASPVFSSRNILVGGLKY